MSSAELGIYSLEEHSVETVSALKRALYMDPEMPHWLSDDGQYMYIANPMNNIPPEIRPYMPAWQFTQCMNAWQLCRVSARLIDGRIPMNMYTIISGVTMLATRHEIDPDMLSEGLEQEVLSLISESARLQCELGYQEPEIIDYANVDNALFDLAKEMELYRMAKSG